MASTEQSPSQQREDVVQDVQAERVLEETKANIAKLVQGLDSDNTDVVVESIRKLRNSLPHGNPTKNPVVIDTLIELNALPKLVDLLDPDYGYRDVQISSSQLFRRICSVGTEHHVGLVIEAGSCPVLIRLLQSGDSGLVEAAVWALSTIAYRGYRFRDLLISLGIVPILIGIINRHVEELDLPVSYCCCTLLYHNEQPSSDVIEACLPALEKLLWFGDEKVDRGVHGACQALVMITNRTCTNDYTHELQRLGILGRLVEIINTWKVERVLVRALKAMENIVDKGKVQAQILVGHGLLYGLKRLLSDEQFSKHVLRVTKILAKLTDIMDEALIQAVMEAGLAPLIVRLLQSEDAEDVKEQAVLTICHITGFGYNTEIEVMMQADALHSVLELLVRHSDNAKLKDTAIDAIKNMLQYGKEVNQFDAMWALVKKVRLPHRTEELLLDREVSSDGVEIGSAGDMEMETMDTDHDESDIDCPDDTRYWCVFCGATLSTLTVVFACLMGVYSYLKIYH